MANTLNNKDVYLFSEKEGRIYVPLKWALEVAYSAGTASDPAVLNEGSDRGCATRTVIILSCLRVGYTTLTVFVSL